MSDYTSVDLDQPRIEAKRAITIAGIRRRLGGEGFDVAEFDRQTAEMHEQLPDFTGRVSDRVYDIFRGMFTDLGGGVFEYLVSVEVYENATLPEGFTTLSLPAQPYAIVANRLADSPRDTVFTLWHEWLPTSGHAHPGGDLPEFIYEHGEDYVEDERNGPLDVYVPVAG